jgi:NAD(P)-dependent dehydrogenase (short-subunit alcohol dehydrogenase family)
VFALPTAPAASAVESEEPGHPAPAGRLEGRIALITGGGTGIGRAIALIFAREGAKVVVAGRRSEPLQQVVGEIRSQGATATFSRGDVTRTERVELMVQGAIFNFGGLDILVNAAGCFIEGSVTDTDEKRWDRIIGTNLKGAYMVSRLAIPAMRQRGGGSIINIASVFGLTGMERGAAYCASKGGLIQLTRAMALDCAPDRIRVNAICPGQVDTPMMRDDKGRPTRLAAASRLPMGRPGTAEDVAGLALFLASSEARYMTGAVLSVDGGFLAS